jgi:hypothetical protein
MKENGFEVKSLAISYKTFYGRNQKMRAQDCTKEFERPSFIPNHNKLERLSLSGTSDLV